MASSREHSATHSSEVERTTNTVLNNFVKSRCNRYFVKRLNNCKRKWRKLMHDSSHSFVNIQSYPSDVMSSINDTCDKYERTICSLVANRRCVVNQCKDADRANLLNNLHHYTQSMAYIKTAIDNNSDNITTELCNTTKSHFTELINTIVANGTVKCKKLQRIITVNTSLPQSALLQHRTHGLKNIALTNSSLNASPLLYSRGHRERNVLQESASKITCQYSGYNIEN